MAKDSLIKGTVILAAAALVARFLGLIQKVPLQHILGDDGLATYGIAYSVYSMLLIVATAGIPSALSKLVSERYAIGSFGDAQRIYRAAVWFAVVTGVTSSLLLFVFAPAYANGIAKDPHSSLAIRAIAPALLIFPLIAIMRGYFQGRQVMKAGALSQIFEQIVRVTTAVGIACILMLHGQPKETIAAGASFGAVTGAVAALIVMLVYQRSKNREDIREGLTPQAAGAAGASPLGYKQIYRMLLLLSIPISIISLAVPMVYFIDNSTVIGLLEGRIGAAEAKEQLGILTGKAQSLAGIPPILAIALSTSVVPVVSSAYARQDDAEVADKSSLALRIAVITGLPVVIALSVAAESVIGFLFRDAVGWEIASMLTATTMFQIVMMTSSSILMGLGQTMVPMLYVVAGIAVKLAGNMLLGPVFGMPGILMSTLICFALIMGLNLCRLRRMVPYRILGSRWPGVLLTGAVLTGTGIGLVLLFDHLSWISRPGRIGYLIEAGVIGSVILLLYPVCLFLFRAVLAEDVERFPRPLRKVLAPFQRRFAGKKVQNM